MTDYEDYFKNLIIRKYHIRLEAPTFSSSKLIRKLLKGKTFIFISLLRNTKGETLKGRIDCEIFLSEHFMKS